VKDVFAAGTSSNGTVELTDLSVEAIADN